MWHVLAQKGVLLWTCCYLSIDVKQTDGRCTVIALPDSHNDQGVHVGAGFHNSSLYEALRASIGPLVALLRDEEDKTRANAAGALGNLVRNSGLLCRPLIEARALQVLHTFPGAC